MAARCSPPENLPKKWSPRISLREAAMRGGGQGAWGRRRWRHSEPLWCLWRRIETHADDENLRRSASMSPMRGWPLKASNQPKTLT